MHLQARLAHQITFRFTIWLILSMLVTQEGLNTFEAKTCLFLSLQITFQLTFRLPALPQAHYVSASSARHSDHLSVHHLARF